jgi:hypothetical protein
MLRLNSSFVGLGAVRRGEPSAALEGSREKARGKRFIRSWILVTTSYVALQAYQEIKEDGHPIVIISAQDIVNLLQKAGLGDVVELRKWLSAF